MVAPVVLYFVRSVQTTDSNYAYETSIRSRTHHCIDKLTPGEREAVALLDAAANTRGDAVLYGIGERERLASTGEVRYWIDEKVK